MAMQWLLLLSIMLWWYEWHGYDNGDDDDGERVNPYMNIPTAKR